MFWIQIVLAFFAGVVISMFLSTFINFGFTIIMIKGAQLDALEMLKNTGDSIDSLLGFKNTALRLVDTPNDIARSERELFDQSYKIIKDSSILKLKSVMPSKFKTLSQYDDWDGAMEFLKQERENDRE